MSQYITVEYNGSRYCGESENGVLHGSGLLVEADKKGVFEGLWVKGNQLSGVYTWPTGRLYEGDWKGHARSGLGVESRPDGTRYSGDFFQNSMGPLGVLSLPSHGLYMGMWNDAGLQEGDGVEAYADGGFYRGQYKSGQRNGYGTRSSAGHEQRKHIFDSPGTKKTTDVKMVHRPSVAAIINTNMPQQDHAANFNTLKKGEEVGAHAGSSGSADDVNSGVAWDQIYEGEWANDKRCGHGILKVSDYFTYYGQWKENTRTGYGVLVYEGYRDRKGRRKREIKEEGRWENGKLVEPVRHSKILVMKKTDLQERVEKAHEAAINAATLAREKAKTAESKANTAASKSKVAETKASEARVHAATAAERVERASRITSEALNDAHRIKGTVRIVLSDHESHHERGMKRRSKTLNGDQLYSYYQLASEKDHTHRVGIHPTQSCQNFHELQKS